MSQAPKDPSGPAPVIDGGTLVRTRAGVLVGVVVAVAGAAGWATTIHLKVSSMEGRMDDMAHDVRDIRNVLIHTPGKS